MHRSYPKKAGFRLGIYVCKDAEIVDFAAPHGVFSVARRFDPELDAFVIAEAMRPVQAQAGFAAHRPLEDASGAQDSHLRRQDDESRMLTRDGTEIR